MQDDDKWIAAEAAVGEIVDGMAVGIGTGTTVAFAIAAIGRRIGEWPAVRFFATSQATVRAARAVGIAIASFADESRLDLAIDGVDEIDPAFRAIKGGGGALLREKIVASAAQRMVAIADGSKRVAVLGKAPVPVEVLPFARSFVAAEVERLGGEPTLRMGRDIAYRTNQGNLILDCRFAELPDPERLAVALQAIPGLLGHGLFLDQIDAAYVATDGIVTKLQRPAV
ncbi:MAG: ribose-5-phosphate isomerase RpiA [Sphingomonas sp.]|uniref:ribose-5-phosphate isomerase RpiA n=1 Tax=Sphingomonas sp. TaxID=28214 RepID=UPI001AC1867A|nr:ribose-5-phosphate isomerase RpiA [Sphingomonas sp.]MBN8807292.1 ribose-5-phosphate isomerase RpiA [Sphingomonas sp.]